MRIVTIPGADVCACCGTHTATTGQVGQIKILASENYKGGVRLSVVCGQRALAGSPGHAGQRQADIGALLSAKSTETANAVHRVYEEYTALKFAHFGLCSQLFDTHGRSWSTPGEDAIRIVNGTGPGRPAPAGRPPERGHQRPVRRPDPHTTRAPATAWLRQTAMSAP